MTRSGRRGSRTLKAHRSSVFETVAITRWLALPDMSCRPFRAICGSGGNRTHVLRFKRPVQRQHLLPTRVARMAPPLGVEPRPSALQADAQTSYARVGKMGYLAIPLVLNYAVVKEVSRNFEFRTQESNPDVTVQSRASCHWTSPDQRRDVRASAGLPFERRVPLAVGPQGVEPRGSLWTTRLQRAPASLPV